MSHPILIMAGKEIREGLRNRWVLSATGLLFLLALALAFLGSAPAGTVGASPLAVTVVSLASLSIYLIPLIALLVAFDAIVGEAERGTLLLLLSYPLSRSQLLVGKFLGHAAILAFAVVVGYGAAALILIARDGVGGDDPAALALLMGSSVLLGWIFIGLGYVASLLARERASAAGLAIAVWLLMVVLFDMALLGLLVSYGADPAVGRLAATLLMANPTDLYRLLNLSTVAGVAELSGLGTLAGGLNPWAIGGLLVAWTAVPLGLAGWLIQRREL